MTSAPGITELDLHLPDGRTLHVYQTENNDAFPMFWFHGTPNLGSPPGPLLEHAAKLGFRWVSCDRPAYGRSTPVPDRSVASAASDVKAIADHLGLDHFVVMGHSGGGPHALACAALLPDRVKAAVSLSGLAPFDAPGLDYFAGMHPSSVASLSAAAQGRAAKEAFEASAPEFDPEVFTPADHAALSGRWSWLNEVVEPALVAGPEGLIEDDLAYVKGWGFEPAQLKVPTLIVHGEEDRMVPVSHARWLATQVGHAELWANPEAGHIAILDLAPAALAWLKRQLWSDSTTGLSVLG
ncbi:alpha/beta hydrolase [Deinococcus cellulosilyticus NBRC 106333 = KACC 11606]|uniref:Alpha/beta hydrolase n=1 Tax=Deinococcus cellulosilyticus (strain DSM 18568 / NBRC 106333 / KACC 11606 / 5516J-15) TaxID=1223518 RepID=A0A511MZ97_DEIC1|nr:alpha/beta hydrolase [Deinococcus cellulosilyticus NBRC 106333 = KACC 11606]